MVGDCPYGLRMRFHRRRRRHVLEAKDEEEETR